MKKFFNLSFPQKSIMLTENFYKNTNVNNICGTAIIKEKINFEILEKAIRTVLTHNQSFWIRFTMNKNVIKQYLSPLHDFSIEIVDIEDEEEIENIEKSMSQKVYEILDSDLFEFKIFRLPKGSGGFILNIHHFIADSWTLGLTCREIIIEYSTLLGKNVQNIQNEYYDYFDFLKEEEEYKQSKKFLKDKEYWNNLLTREINPAILPSDIFNDSSNISSIGERLVFSISKNKMKLITDFCAQNKISTFNFLTAIYSIYISKIINSNYFSIGTPILNRTNYKEKNMTGMFINIVPLFFDIDKNIDFNTYTSGISRDTISMLRHQKYPYQLMLEELRKKDSSIPNLYNIVLSYQLTKSGADEGIDYKTRWAFSGSCTDDLTIQFLDLDKENKLNVMYDFKKLKFSSDYIRNMHTRIIDVINQVLKNPNILIKDINVITKYESDKILKKFNDTSVRYDKKNNVIKQFKNIVKKFPNKIAIISNEERISYKELDEESDYLANYMINKGINHGDIVGVMINRGIRLSISILAILKAGAAYLPIDPEYPIDRIEYMLNDSDAKLLLVSNKTNDLLKHMDKKINVSDEDIYEGNIDKVKESIKRIMPDDLIYVIYTSGSTGKPKGVMLKHINIINFLEGTKREIDFSPEKIMCSITTICFDIFVLEFWGSLVSGMTLVLANENEQSNYKKLNTLCFVNKVDMIQTTPSRFKHIIDTIEKIPGNFLNNIKDIMVGGEALPKDLVQKFSRYSNANIYNMYGPTETAVWSTIKKIKNANNITIGRPISNTTCYILNNDGNPLPPYIPGELYIGGDGVSNGYINRDDLTKEKFIKSPFIKKETIYNTNDLAYFLDNGDIVHLGRTDFQVKIRGYRIELEEIENRLVKFDGIKNAVVTPDKNMDYLICYYIADNEINTEEASNFLLEDLPNYMIPALYHKMKRFPLTPNGKLDRKSLPKIELQKTKSKTGETKVEKLLSKIVAEVLDEENISSDKIDVNAPFITLGLDSLGIIQVQTKLLQYHYVLNTQDFYKCNTIKSLAENIDNNIYTYKEQDAQVPVRFRHTFDEIITKIDEKVSDTRFLGNVFLTGANGFIGIHILRELLRNQDIKVYCLVRSKKDNDSKFRLIQKYKFYFDEDISKLIGKKIFVYDGNIVKEDIGLNIDDLNTIKDNVSTVIHTAARVKHYGDYDEFNAINTNGTKNLLEFAFQNKLRFIHLSSVSVSGNYLVKQDNRNIEFTENNLFIGQNYTDNVYVNSKFEAEKIVLQYMEKGLTAQIHRLGILSGRYRDGVFQENIKENAFYSRIKTMIVLGMVSEKMMDQKIEFTPVDLCTRDIVALAKNKIADNKIYHLYNHNFVKIKDIINVLKTFDININVVSNQALQKRVLEISESSNELDLIGIINDIGNTDDNELLLNYSYTVNIRSDYTQKYLHLLKCDWNDNDQKYLKKIIRYMRKVGFI